MLIFDAHTHIFPDKIAAGALVQLQERSGGIPVFTQGTLSDLAQKAQEAGYSGWLNCPVTTSEKQMLSINDHVARTNIWPHLSMGGLFPNADIDTVLSCTTHIKELGLLGIKFHPEYQQFNPNDRRLDALWDLCCDLDLPVLFHAGRDIGFPGQHHSTPSDYKRLSERFPKLVIICAHLGGWRDWDEVYDSLAGANVYLDTSFARPWMDDKSLFEKIIRKHGISRILYGTDSPWADLKEGIREISESTFSDQEKEDIFWNNADSLFKLNRFLP